ncbi:MAG: CbiX/SirB N-terminal domain-containing protein [Phycisphaerae bacterium]
MASAHRLSDQRHGSPGAARGLALAAHGSHHAAEVNETVQAIATAVHETARTEDTAFNEVVACFHQGTPAFSEVLDRMLADTITVVPLMTSEGYFAREVLPAALRCNRRFDEVRVKITPVLGAHEAIPNMLADRVRTLCGEHRIPPRAVSVVVVGHGTRRNAQSRNQTIQTAQAVAELGPWAQTVHAFIDDDPAAATALGRCGSGAVVVVPFLISAGPHARHLPHQLGLDAPRRVVLPFTCHRSEGTVIVDEPLLRHPALPELVGELARTTANHLPAGSK